MVTLPIWLLVRLSSSLKPSCISWLIFFDRRRRHRETIRLDRDHSLLFSRRGQDDSVAHLLHQVDVRARSSSDAGKSWKHALVFVFHYYYSLAVVVNDRLGWSRQVEQSRVQLNNGIMQSISPRSILLPLQLTSVIAVSPTRAKLSPDGGPGFEDELF